MSTEPHEARFVRLYQIAHGLLESFKDGQTKQKTVSQKAQDDVVTNLDLLLDQHITAALNSIDPGISVFSEENINSSIRSDYEFSSISWLVDPLDGTANFVQGLPAQAISFAKCQAHTVLEAVTIDLNAERIFVAIKNKGCQVNGSRLTKISSKVPMSGVSTGWLRNSSTCELEKLLGKCKLRLLGSQAMHLVMVAEGSLISAFSYEARAWDDVAGALILEEMGGTYFSPVLMDSRGWIDLAARDEPMQSRAYGTKN